MTGSSTSAETDTESSNVRLSIRYVAMVINYICTIYCIEQNNVLNKIMCVFSLIKVNSMFSGFPNTTSNFFVAITFFVLAFILESYQNSQ